MCQTAISIISKALDDVDNADLIVKIKGVVALFIQTMEVTSLDIGCKLHLTVQGWGYCVTSLDNFLLTLFEKYATILKRRFIDDFQEVFIPTSYKYTY